VLGLGIPAGFEGFFLSTGRPAEALTLPPPPAGPPDMAALLSAAAAHGCDIVGPPLGP